MEPLPGDLLEDVPSRSPIALPLGYVLADQYVLGRVLGQPGGFGVTYLAWDRALARRAAIKEYLPRDLVGRAADGVSIQPHSDGDRGGFSFGLDRFLAEARTLAGLHHPNVIGVHRFFEANGTAYLVMDYHRGASLAEVLLRAGGRLPWRAAVEILLAALEGLRATHASGFLHCDIKPQNIYLTADSQVILLDYGAAKRAVSERTRTLARIMTPGYAAFEMYLEKAELGVWTDIYACGATLYQLITGKKPPSATDRLLQDDFLKKLDCGAPEVLRQTLSRALALDAARRTPSVEVLAGELRSLLAHEAGSSSSSREPNAAIPTFAPVLGEETGSWMVTSSSRPRLSTRTSQLRQPRRHRQWLLAALTLSVLMTAGYGLGWSPVEGGTALNLDRDADISQEMPWVVDLPVGRLKILVELETYSTRNTRAAAISAAVPMASSTRIGTVMSPRPRPNEISWCNAVIAQPVGKR